MVLFAMLIAISSCFACLNLGNCLNLGKQPMQRSQEHLKPCYIYGACKSGDNDRRILQHCYDGVETHEDFYGMLRRVNFQSGNKFKSSSLYGVIEELCGMESTEQDTAMTEFGTTGLEFYSEDCANPLKKEICELWNKVLNCLMDAVDQFKDDGKCSILPGSQ